jgi:acetylornithine deacetylase/succinyl-diaminopimelate desuccinylase-like protein
MRLVPNQDPEDIAKKFTNYVKSLIPKNAEFTEIKHSGAYPYVAPTYLPIYNIAKKCLTVTFGKKCIFDGVGGSIGFVPIVAKELNIPCLLIGLGKPSDNIHAPNEHISVDNYLKGIKAIRELLNLIGNNNVK